MLACAPPRPSVACFAILCYWLATAAGPRAIPDEPHHQPPADKTKLIAGKAEVLRAVPKRFAALTAVDPKRRRVTLLVEGESLPKVWSLAPDAELRLAGWWGRLDQFQIGDRVWVWFNLDRNKQPIGILMLADELSEQDIHGQTATVEGRQANTLTVKMAQGAGRPLKIANTEVYRGKEKTSVDSLRRGETVYIQSVGDRARLILDAAALEARRDEQRAALRKRWLDQGLPGTVVFLHISGEMELMLDHEAMRWARSLQPGDKVTLQTATPIAAQVQQVRPWRERTQVRLVVGGSDQADLAVGQRLHLRMPAPPAAVENSPLPPDLDRPRGKAERIEWFLASIYCTCSVKGDTCTGDFYTLSSCNPNGCGMPNHTRQVIGEKIEKGLADKQILEELLKERGPRLLRSHLLP